MANYKETGIGTEDSTELSKFPLDDVDKVALKVMLQERLKECGWSKSVQQRIRNILTERGVKNVTHAQLAAEIMPQVELASIIRE